MVADAARFDEPTLKALGARGVLKLADGGVQVVVGPIADQLASEIRAELRRVPAAAPGDGVLARDDTGRATELTYWKAVNCALADEIVRTEAEDRGLVPARYSMRFDQTSLSRSPVAS